MRWAWLSAVLAATVPAYSPVLGGRGGEAKGPSAIVGSAFVGGGVNYGDTFFGYTHFDVVGGYVAGRGWVSSEEAAGTMSGGDRIALHRPLSARPVGEITLTGVERMPREDETQWGLICEAWVGERFPEPGRAYVGAWSSDTDHTPRWLDAESLSTSNHVYRRVIGEWLSARGVPQSAIATVEITQIVRTDINEDGRDEVFVALETPGIAKPDASGKWRLLCHVREVSPGSPDCQPGPTPEVFSYLLMRHVPPGAKVAQTVVLADDSLFSHEVIGFCHVDGDGWAEVVSRSHKIDYGDTRVHYWTGDSYRALSGFGGGV